MTRATISASVGSAPAGRGHEVLQRDLAVWIDLRNGIRPVPFGHMGDGNIHFNLEQPPEMAAADFLAQDHAILDAVNAVVRDLDGSFSAEHGVGRL